MVFYDLFKDFEFNGFCKIIEENEVDVIFVFLNFYDIMFIFLVGDGLW